MSRGDAHSGRQGALLVIEMHLGTKTQFNTKRERQSDETECDVAELMSK